MGGVAYAAYYLSFLVAGLIIYQLRTKGGFRSIHHFLESRYGQGAIILFSILIGFRLFNEVWSNTMVIGSYFGAQGSPPYYMAIVVFTSLTLAYTLKGGMSSSILTDLIQMLFFGGMLIILLAVLFPKTEGGMTSYLQSGTWEMSQGGNLLLVALIQSLSYPFHDPVLTDRGFISDPKTTLRAYLMATVIGGLCIVLFSFVGIFGQFNGLSGQAPVAVAQLLGIGIMLLMNFIMITSAASTLDSTFTSFSKFLSIDLLKRQDQSLSFGRWSMAAIAIIGTLPVFMGPEILSATTISGTMVIGLAPVFIFWHLEMPKASFYVSVGMGLVIGLLFTLGLYPEQWNWTSGKYADLLSVNVWGTIACFGLFFLLKKFR